jgi:hypothetical protein
MPTRVAHFVFQAKVVIVLQSAIRYLITGAVLVVLTKLTRVAHLLEITVVIILWIIWVQHQAFLLKFQIVRAGSIIKVVGMVQLAEIPLVTSIIDRIFLE